jgi:hypothetical protein
MDVCHIWEGSLPENTGRAAARREHERDPGRSARELGLGGGDPPLLLPVAAHEGAHTGPPAARGSLRRFAALAPGRPGACWQSPATVRRRDTGNSAACRHTDAIAEIA